MLRAYLKTSKIIVLTNLYSLGAYKFRYFSIFNKRQDFNGVCIAETPNFINRKFNNQKLLINYFTIHDYIYILKEKKCLNYLYQHLFIEKLRQLIRGILKMGLTV